MRCEFIKKMAVLLVHMIYTFIVMSPNFMTMLIIQKVFAGLPRVCTLVLVTIVFWQTPGSVCTCNTVY